MKQMKAALTSNDRAAVNEFKEILLNKLDSSLLEMKLFGSKVKGYSTPHSDLDILIVVTKVGKDIKDKIFDAAVDINLKYEVVISPSIYTREDFYNTRMKNTYFYIATHDEGISL